MTPANEAHFINLWNQGLETAAIAQAMGIPQGTVSSRAHVLQLRGLIQPRPRGGPHARRVAQARQEGNATPVQRSVQRLDTGAEHSVDTGAVQRLDRLESEVQGLRHLIQAVVDRLDHPPVQTPVQISAVPPYPKGKTVRWNLWILDAIRDEPAQRGVSPSQLVQELLRKALSDHRSSTP